MLPDFSSIETKSGGQKHVYLLHPTKTHVTAHVFCRSVTDITTDVCAIFIDLFELGCCTTVLVFFARCQPWGSG